MPRKKVDSTILVSKDALQMLKEDIIEGFDSKLTAQSTNILEEMDHKFKQQLLDVDNKLKQQKEEIVTETAEYVADSLIPLMDNHGKRLDRVEEKLDLPTLQI